METENKDSNFFIGKLHLAQRKSCFTIQYLRKISVLKFNNENNMYFIDLLLI